MTNPNSNPYYNQGRSKTNFFFWQGTKHRTQTKGCLRGLKEAVNVP